MDTEVKRLIPAQRCKDERLDFIEERTVDDEGVTRISYKIMDTAGVEYNGILQSNGTVFDGYMTHHNAETFERFKGPTDSLCGWWWANWWHEILRDQNGQIYIWKQHKQVSPSEYIMHLPTAGALAEFVFDLEQPQILEFPNSGHWAVFLPEDVREELTDTAYHRWEDKSRQEIIVERLRRPPLTEEEKRELLRARAPQPSGAHKAQIAWLVEQIRQKQAAAQAPDLESDLTFEEHNCEFACDDDKDSRDAAAAGYEEEKISEVTA